MTLAALIRGRRAVNSVESATAIPATVATLAGGKGRTVATVATVAVANPQNSANEARPDPAAEARRQRVLAEPEQFTFAPPGDPENNAEAIAERAAIMAVENGWDDARALQEARWHADKERAWRAFLRNAARIQVAPEGEREALLARYRAEAERRYGERTALDMARSLASWVRARGVH